MPAERQAQPDRASERVRQGRRRRERRDGRRQGGQEDRDRLARHGARAGERRRRAVVAAARDAGRRRAARALHVRRHRRPLVRLRRHAGRGVPDRQHVHRRRRGRGRLGGRAQHGVADGRQLQGHVRLHHDLGLCRLAFRPRGAVVQAGPDRALPLPRDDLGSRPDLDGGRAARQPDTVLRRRQPTRVRPPLVCTSAPRPPVRRVRDPRASHTRRASRLSSPPRQVSADDADDQGDAQRLPSAARAAARAVRRRHTVRLPDASRHRLHDRGGVRQLRRRRRVGGLPRLLDTGAAPAVRPLHRAVRRRLVRCAAACELSHSSTICGACPPSTLTPAPPLASGAGT